MKILIFGANGQLGRALCDELKASLIGQVIQLARDSCDFLIKGNVLECLTRYSPSLIINCAAITNVDFAEREPGLTHRVNVQAVQEMCKYSKLQGARLIQISTDYVFDGLKDQPYLTGDQVNPINVYGHSKAQAESFLQQEIPTNSVIIRTSSLYGGSRSNFVSFVLESVEKKRELTLPVDQMCQPTHVRDLSELVISIIRNPTAAGIVHAASAGEVSKFEFAQTILKVNALPPNLIVPTSFAEMMRVASRPKRSILDCSKNRSNNLFDIGDWKERFFFFESIRKYIC